MANDERIELYRKFIEVMQELDFSVEYIAEQLALVVNALYRKVN